MTPLDLGDWFAAAAGGSMLLALPVAVVAGVVSFFSPCVLPLLPGYLSYATGLAASDVARADGHRGRILLGTSLFVAGFALVFVSTGALFGGLGSLLFTWSRAISIAIGIVAIALGLVFAGVIRFGQGTTIVEGKGRKQRLCVLGAPAMQALRALPNLGFLDLNGNPVYDITPIASCTNLKGLNIGGTSTNNISALAGLTQLDFLSLFNCEATDYSPLANLTSLRVLFIGYSKISDLSVRSVLIVCGTDKGQQLLASILQETHSVSFAASGAQARRMLDKAGLSQCRIAASNSLDEWLIRELLRQGAALDIFGVGEKLITAKSDPVFGGVYKLAAVEDEQGRRAMCCFRACPKVS